MRSPQATYTGHVRSPASHYAPGATTRSVYPLIMIRGVYASRFLAGHRLYLLPPSSETSSKLRRRMAGRTAILRFAKLAESHLRG